MVRLSITHFLNFLFHVLTIKQVIESVSGYCLWLLFASSVSDVTRGTDNTAKMGKT